MYGDPGEIRAVAARLRSLAGDTRAQQQLVVSAEGVEWRSAAADAFREELAERAAQVSRCAGELVDAASAVDRHADAVEARIAAIQAAEAWARQEIAELRRTASAVADGVVDGVKDLAAGAWDRLRRLPADLPSAGSVDWLEVSGRLGRGR